MTTESTDVVMERLLDAAVSTTDLIAIALGDRLGYYRCLAERDAVTSPELAEETGTVEQCAREWLEQQAVSGLLDVADDGCGNPAGRKFRMAEGVSAVLVDPDQLSYLAPLARQLVAAAQQVPAIAEAFRTGRGVPWARHGTDMRESQAEMNRPGYLQLLPTEWRLMYGFSLAICLPDSMSSPGSAATGSVIRQHAVGHYAKKAGFGTVETLDLEHDL